MKHLREVLINSSLTARRKRLRNVSLSDLYIKKETIAGNRALNVNNSVAGRDYEEFTMPVQPVNTKEGSIYSRIINIC